MFSFFKKKLYSSSLKVDIHSHLLPSLDDGVKTVEESLSIIRHFESLGYKKLITTPHVMADVYRNTAEDIQNKLTLIQSVLKEQNLNITLHAAAEYYLDEQLMQSIHNHEKLLTLHDKYLLFETNFLSEPLNMKEFIFLASSRGYKLILAHPERYVYLYRQFDKLEDLLNRGVLFQVNITSLTGYYSKQAKQMAIELINRGWVHWLGSDCHHIGHAHLVSVAISGKYFQKALDLPLLNNSIE